MVDCLGHRSKCSLPSSLFLCRHATLIAGEGGGGGGRALHDYTRVLVFKNPALAPLSFSLLSHTLLLFSVVQFSSNVWLPRSLSLPVLYHLTLPLIFNFTMSVKRYRATHSYIHIKYIPLLSPASSNLSKRGWWKLSLQNKTLWLV